MSNSRGFWEPIPYKIAIQGTVYSVPKYSPDGKMMAYIMGQNGLTALMVLDLKSGVSLQLTADQKISTGTAYGGGVYCWTSDSNYIIFSSGGKLCRVPVDGGEVDKLRSVDLSFNPSELNGRILFSIEHEDTMSIGSIQGSGWPERLPFDGDFLYDAVENPVSGDIAVHQWDFPNMSWNSSRILLLHKGKVKVVADGVDEAVCQPRFSPDGKHLAYISDKNGWWNLWIADGNGNNSRILVDAQEEHSYSTWVTGASNFQWLADSESIIFTRNRMGDFGLSKVNIITGEIVDLESVGGDYSNLSINHSTNELVFEFSSFNVRKEIRVLDTISGEIRTIFKSGLVIPKSSLAKIPQPKSIRFPTEDGEHAYGLLYSLPDSRGKIHNCPTIFLVHGGPTGMAKNEFKIQINYWVSMGWAVFAVNHRGSIGYGRQYREKLNGNWGLYDVSDTKDAREYLIKEGITNPEKTVVMGGSAGGYTTLMCLATYPGTFTAGVNLYGVSDLFGLSEETHYLESQYDTILVGPLPKASKKFFERSPIYLADKIIDPLLILQGEDDPVVPKNQSDRISKMVKGEVEYKVYPGEGHGFRKIETIQDMLTRTMKFLRKYVLYDRP